jgi:hypothetical protein
MIYPNPASERITVELFGVQTNSKVHSLVLFYSVTGNEVLRGYAVGSKSELNITHLPKGLYFVTLSSRTRFLLANL